MKSRTAHPIMVGGQPTTAFLAKTSLAAPVTWTSFVGTPVLNAGTWTLSIPTPASPQFFRLKWP